MHSSVLEITGLVEMSKSTIFMYDVIRPSDIRTSLPIYMCTCMILLLIVVPHCMCTNFGVACCKIR